MKASFMRFAMLYYMNDTVKPVPVRDKLLLTLFASSRKGKESVNIFIMRTRPLVLSTESARHPFRQRLPAHVFRLDAEKKEAKRQANDDQDWKLFMLSFSAFFTAFYSFIA